MSSGIQKQSDNGIMSKSIFISYKRTDSDKVCQIVDKIRERTQQDIWIDLKGVESGDWFQNTIIRAINECEIVIFMLSKDSIVVPDWGESWTQREVSFALRKGKRLIIVSIDGTNVNDCDWLSFICGGLNCTDISDEKQKERMLETICNHLGVRLQEKKNKTQTYEAKYFTEEQKLKDKGKDTSDYISSLREAASVQLKDCFARVECDSAVYLLANAYFEGKIVEKDINECVNFLAGIVNHNNEGVRNQAKLLLSKCYLEKQSKDKAMHLLRAIIQDNSEKFMSDAVDLFMSIYNVTNRVLQTKYESIYEHCIRWKSLEDK